MQIGYARVSSDDQNLDLQYDALKAAGCKKIFDDRVSGAHVHRPGLERLLETVREGDSVIVWRLDRLGRSMKDLLQVVAQLESNGVELSSLKEKIDTSSSGGRLIFHIFAALAELAERLITPLQINQHLTMALEAGRSADERPVSAGIVQSIISPNVTDWESTLARLGYDDKSIAGLLDSKTGEVRALFKGTLDASRTSQLLSQLKQAVGISSK